MPRSTRPSAAKAFAAGSVMHSASASAWRVCAMADSDGVTTTSWAPEPRRRRPSSRSMSSRGPGSGSASSRARTTGAPAASASRSMDAPPAAVKRSGSSLASSRGIRRVPDLVGLRVDGLLGLRRGLLDRVHLGACGDIAGDAERRACGLELAEHLSLDARGGGDHLVGLALLVLGGRDAAGSLVEQALTLAMDLLDLEVGSGAHRGKLVLDEGVEGADRAVDGAGEAVDIRLGACGRG